MHRLLLLLALLPLAAGASDPVSTLESYFSEVETLRGEFLQETTDEAGTVIEEAEGTFVIARPQRFRWHYETPYEQLIVADGERLWVYDVDLRQVTVRPLDRVLGVGAAQLLSGEFEALTESFSIVAGEGDWIRLEPTDPAWDFQHVRLLLEDGVPRVVEVRDDIGQSVRMRLSALERNPEVPEARFDFEPPPEADVIEDGASAGEE
ncbi:outer membrane lipoprotein chaperone LolA [Sediminicurvatus halobius]|uniref:Outer-membrane lipoprotein carrier protein n=1 Tax=Sediminicurvatus halobius TaxID=2182432 RepID=A0A2U2MZV5_9GAMM|nr:outer membrane lipoprotein chaperone LolA [Spiribacter halobius]PWG62410.1 outer membrane lipoprotein carrier protein LolA [Spiribacter halobius]UEX79510.1 outer membrane lipoprotein chaperone LolA [Spiribacter halobius]